MSAGIFVVLALGWAGYLIPKALSHHDEVARTRSVDHVSHSLRVLPRRQDPAAQPARPVVRPEVQRRAAAGAARRRRRILLLLLLADVVVGALATASLVQRWALLIPAGLTLGFLMLSSRLGKRQRSSYDAVSAHIARRRAEIAFEDARDLVEPPRVRVRNGQGFEEVSDSEETSAIRRTAGLADAAPADGSLWDPLPMTLPTYVGMPVVARTVRTIDLSDPAISSSGHDAADSELVAQAQAGQSGAAGDARVPEQRAVNE